MNRLKKGDQVYIISGKDKGKLGVVSQIVSEERILVDGINLAKKHVKPNPNSAPALVDWTRWETPIAVPANNKPGPSFFIKLLIIPITLLELIGTFTTITTVFSFLI